ncbi:MAG: hypothetical protein ACQERF_05740 [Actinomycetota bacterium]
MEIRATDPDRSGLDELNPETHPARDAVHFRRIVAARANLLAAEEELRAAVEASREAGDSWIVIGAALGISRQAAQQRFGRHGAGRPPPRAGLLHQPTRSAGHKREDLGLPSRDHGTRIQCVEPTPLVATNDPRDESGGEGAVQQSHETIVT